MRLQCDCVLSASLFLAVGFYLMRNINKSLSAGLKVSVTAFNPLLAPLAQLQPVTFRVSNGTVCFRRLTGRISQLHHDRAPADIQQSSKLFPQSVGVTTSGRLCPTCHFSFPLAPLRHRTSRFLQEIFCRARERLCDRSSKLCSSLAQQPTF